MGLVSVYTGFGGFPGTADLGLNSLCGFQGCWMRRLMWGGPVCYRAVVLTKEAKPTTLNNPVALSVLGRQGFRACNLLALQWLVAGVSRSLVLSLWCSLHVCLWFYNINIYIYMSLSLSLCFPPSLEPKPYRACIPEKNPLNPVNAMNIVNAINPINLLNPTNPIKPVNSINHTNRINPINP